MKNSGAIPPRSCTEIKVCLYEGLGGPPEYLCTEGFSRNNSLSFDVEMIAIRKAYFRESSEDKKSNKPQTYEMEKIRTNSQETKTFQFMFLLLQLIWGGVILLEVAFLSCKSKLLPLSSCIKWELVHGACVKRVLLHQSGKGEIFLKRYPSCKFVT